MHLDNTVLKDRSNLAQNGALGQRRPPTRNPAKYYSAEGTISLLIFDDQHSMIRALRQFSHKWLFFLFSKCFLIEVSASKINVTFNFSTDHWFFDDVYNNKYEVERSPKATSNLSKH